jgi:hypothetical protein
MRKHILEPAAQQFADATSKPPFLYQLGPEARSCRSVSGRLLSCASSSPPRVTAATGISREVR